MSCICKECGKPCDCEFSTCEYCCLEKQDDTGKNLLSGGNFYPHVQEDK